MKAAPVAFLKITLREKLYSLFFCNFQRARIKRYLLVLLITFPPRHLTETIVDIFRIFVCRCSDFIHARFFS